MNGTRHRSHRGGRLDECIKRYRVLPRNDAGRGRSASGDDRRRVRGMRRSPLATRRWLNYFTRGYTALPYVLPLLLRSSCHLPVTPAALA